MEMNERREARLRKSVSGIINRALYNNPFAVTIAPDDLFIWEIVKLVRNDTIREMQAVLDELRVPEK
ncbi:hypothetical protein [Streptomyces sp. NPDC015131]|uniref:hypothetical protein n=1 Tax=Streptomyces sp. NPDC015131 TaxID=3364941 RepID=UPI0036F66C05